MAQNRTSWAPIVGLTTAMVVWGSSFIALKVACTAYHPMVVIFGRMFIGSLCFLAFWKKVKESKYQKGDWKPLLLMVMFEPCLYFLFETWAITQTTASQAGMITAMLPLLVAVTAFFILKEKITARTIGGFLIAITGIFILSAGAEASESAPNPALGNFLEIIAMFMATGYTIMIKKLAARYSPLVLTVAQSAAGAVFYFPLMFIPPSNLPTQLDPGGLAAILYLGTIVTFGGYGLYNYGVSRIPASQASAFVNLIPVFAIILGWLILDETFTPLQYPAAILVFAGVFISQDRGRSAAKAGVEARG